MPYKITDLVDYDKLFKLFESYSKLIELPFNLVDHTTGAILLSFNITDMCKNFHHKSEEGLIVCKQCKANLLENISKEKQINISHCGFGTKCAAMPIMVEGELIAFLGSGQVFFENPDLEKYRHQAKEYGFDPEKYLEAIKKVPVVTEERFNNILEFLSNLSIVLAELGLEALNRKKAEMHFKSLFENMNESMSVLEFIYDKDGEPIDYKTIDVNPEFVKIAGFPKEHMIGLNGSRFFPDVNGKSAFIDKICEVVKTGKPCSFEAFHSVVNKYFSFSLFALENNKFAVVAREITKFKKYETELLELNKTLKEKEEELTAQNEELLGLNMELEASKNEIKEAFEILKNKETALKRSKFAMDHAAISVFWFGSKGEIYYVNDKTCENLNYTKEEMLSKRIYDINPGYTEKNWNELIAKLKKNRFMSYETSHKTKDGKMIPVLAYGNYFEYEGNEYYLIFVSNISELKELQNNLEERNHKLIKQNEELLAKEKELANIQALFVAALDQSPSGIMIVDNAPGLEVKYINSEALRTFGVSKKIFSEIKNIEQSEIPFALKSNDGRLLSYTEYPIYRAMKENRIIKNEELIIESAKGESFDVIANIAPIYGDNGEIIAGIIVEHDITEIKKARESLKESEEKYSLLFNEMTEGFIYMEAVYNDSGKIVDYMIKDVNPTLEKLLRFKRDDLVNKSLISIFGEEAYSWLEVYKKVTESGIPTNYRKELKFIGKTIFTKLFRPGPDTLAAIISDNTESIKMEKELLEAKDKFQTISDQANDCILLLDSHGNIVYWNSAAERIFGYQEKEILGKNINKTILHQKHFYVAFNRKNLFALNEYNPFANGTLELIGITKEGKEIIAEFSVTSIMHNSEWHFVVIARDITNRKYMEKELEEKRRNLEIIVEKRTKELNDSLKILEQTNLKLKDANKHKDSFLSTMSHELRTPLNAIVGFNKLLEKQYFGTLNEKQLEYVELVQSSSHHLLALINDLLDITRIDSGSVFVVVEKVDSRDFTEEIISIMKQQFKEKNIDLSVYIDDSLENIYVDKRKYKQIMINLLSNALKFTNPGGKVSIKLEETNSSKFKVSVKDSGIGIDKEDQDKVFKEFFQTNHTRDQALGGTGIGLALTKRLVELHSGKLGVESEIGKGSNFWFILPNKPV